MIAVALGLVVKPVRPGGNGPPVRAARNHWKGAMPVEVSVAGPYAAFTVPFGRVDGEIVRGGEFMVRVKVPVVLRVPSLTVTAMVDVPPPTGVPDKTPVPGLRLRLGGRPVADQVKLARPPAAANVNE